MLKYNKNIANVCNGENKSTYEQAKCNKALIDNITKNTQFLLWERCLFMTFEEYKKKTIHINPNICNRVWDSVNEGIIKSEIDKELSNIKAKLKPTSLSIPLPIYVMLAKIIDGDSFNGNYEMILY